MKSCKQCLVEKEEIEFAKRKDKKGRSIFRPVCKPCVNAYKREKYDPVKESIRKKKNKADDPQRYKEMDLKATEKYRNKHRDRLRIKWREYANGRKKVYNKEVAVRGAMKWRAKYPEKYKAQQALSNAVRRGEIVKPIRCQICNNKEKLQAHHHDYDKPYDVVFICVKCHGKLHRK